MESKRQLLNIISNLTNGIIAGNPIPIKEKILKLKQEKRVGGHSKFSDVFLISALNGDGVQDIKVRFKLLLQCFFFGRQHKVFLSCFYSETIPDSVYMSEGQFFKFRIRIFTNYTTLKMASAHILSYFLYTYYIL